MSAKNNYNDEVIGQTVAEQSVEKRDATEDVSDLLCGPESEQDPLLSVVMPTLNEEDGIEECIRRIKTAISELGITAEIIISDSSTDRTPEIARNLGAIVVEPDRSGYGYAYRYAFERARGEYIAIGDADTTYDFEELPKLMRELQESDAEMVMGSRLEGEIKPGAMPPLHRYIGNPLLTRFLNLFYDAGVNDAHSGFRLVTRDALDQLDLRTTGMEFASEMIMEASVKDVPIEEVPITYHEREGDATLDSFRDGWRHVRFMLLNAPGYLFSGPGIAMCAIGLVVMTLAFFNVELTPLAEYFGDAEYIGVGTRSMVVGSLLTIAGYQVASLGVFATIAGNPIQQQQDRFTHWIKSHLTLETGATVGLGIFLAGGGYAAYLVFRWLTIGYKALPGITHDILAFTLIVIGLQTIFGSFFLSAIAEERNR